MRNKFYLLILLIILLIPIFSIDLKKFSENIQGISDNVLYYKALDGKNLAYRVVSPENPKAVLIFLHGITVYGKYYIPFAQELAKYGIKVYLPDIRGHGNSEGRRGDSPNPSTLVQDLGIFYQLVLKENPLLSVYLGGHSMGSALTVKYTRELSLFPAGLILIAGGLPISKISSRSSEILKIKNFSRIFQFLAPIFPHLRIISWEIPKDIKDPLLVSSYSYSFFQSAFPLNIEKIWDNLNLPILAIIGDKDEFYEKKDVEEVIEKYKKEERKFIILKDTDHFEVLEKSVDYIVKWILGGEDGRF